MKRLVLVSIALALGGCASIAPPSSQPQENVVWLRADGQSGRNNPALQAQFSADQAACKVSGGLDRACMVQRGYIPVRPGEAEARAAALRQAAAASAAASAPVVPAGTPQFSGEGSGEVIIVED